jgi:PBP1b-binding outer membrane lipoprotein LpoB
MMKAYSFLAIVALSAFACGGCATETATTTQTTTDQTTTRVHTQEELRKTGESQTGPALEKTDAAIRTEGNH